MLGHAGPVRKNRNDPGGSRTRDLRIKSPLLYQLSYRVWRRSAPATNIVAPGGYSCLVESGGASSLRNPFVQITIAPQSLPLTMNSGGTSLALA